MGCRHSVSGSCRLREFSILLVASAVLAGGRVQAQVTERISLSVAGSQVGYGAEVASYGNGRRVSTDGRFVIFMSYAPDLVPSDTNNDRDVFLRDRVSGTTELLSLASDGTQGNGSSGLFGMAMTPDGKFIAFESFASSLTPPDHNGRPDVFLRDRDRATTERISLSLAGGDANDVSGQPGVSSDARYIVFASHATNLVAGGTNGMAHVFVRDRSRGGTELISVSTSDQEANANCLNPSISDDGRYVAFESGATTLVPSDTNAKSDIFVRDRLNRITWRISNSYLGRESNGNSETPCMSSDGQWVAFASSASNLVPGDTNGFEDVFVCNVATGALERVNVSSSGMQGNIYDTKYPTISGDGRLVAFPAASDNLVPGDTGQSDIFVRDRWAGITERLSVPTGRGQSNGASNYPSISSDGRFVAFFSAASNLAPGDTNVNPDIFIRDRHAAGSRSVCEPGNADTLPCPCGNAPIGANRGCDNGAGTGGAGLSCHGIAYVSMDNLVVTAQEEGDSAPSVLFEGSTLVSGGVLFGQGVRCVDGPIVRLYTGLSSAGSYSVPNLQSGDASVSLRSAAAGVRIQPGHSYYYFVAYRDQPVARECISGGTFNATQACEVIWFP
jgi:Tol biopolymer transport system component